MIILRHSLTENYREGALGTPQGHYFGGLDIVLCGDLHRIPPVACMKSGALCYPVNLVRDSDNAKIGCRIYGGRPGPNIF